MLHFYTKSTAQARAPKLVVFLHPSAESGRLSSDSLSPEFRNLALLYVHADHFINDCIYDFFFIVTLIEGVCNCSLFCCTLLYVHSSIAIILMGKRKLVALLNLPSWCLVMVVRLFLSMPRGCLRFVIVVFPDHTHLLFLMSCELSVCIYVACVTEGHMVE